ncbi:exopolysaccharide biosynthesis polyprenyl glycosylphosphotransferase [Candidatus Wolfebacteria bacterium]|nr:exopolysaccharide biosynthesis polyprenyl glycosylphosphotransferase [Candidatus Wolfebacteria bacterium]
MRLQFINFKKTLIFSGDVIILYFSLAITLVLRYKLSEFQDSFLTHLNPFFIIFLVWIFIFYLFDFYSNKFFQIRLETAQKFLLAIIVNIIISITAFYIFEPFFQLTPKTNLFIFGLVFTTFDYFWRLFISKIFISHGWKKQILFFGDSPILTVIAQYLKDHPQIGYNVSILTQAGKTKSEQENNLRDLIKDNEIETIVIDNNVKTDNSIIKFLYQFLPLHMNIFNLYDFYENIFQKVPLNEVGKGWFIDQIYSNRIIYDTIKRQLDAIFSFILIGLFSPLFIIIAGLIKLTSVGQIIFKQERIGKDNLPFILYKFRTMKTDAQGPLATKINDPRLTFVGKILRYAHLDELPQLFNILKGDISFIGPRPERSELVEIYKKLSYYEIRHIIKPGLTGWAQVNYKPSASLEEAFEKLQYDIYYIKNRSLILDFLILIKTIKYLFVSN